jgi:hypothetical protein
LLNMLISLPLRVCYGKRARRAVIEACTGTLMKRARLRTLPVRGLSRPAPRALFLPCGAKAKIVESACPPPSSSRFRQGLKSGAHCEQGLPSPQAPPLPDINFLNSVPDHTPASTCIANVDFTRRLRSLRT